MDEDPRAYPDGSARASESSPSRGMATLTGRVLGERARMACRHLLTVGDKSVLDHGALLEPATIRRDGQFRPTPSAPLDARLKRTGLVGDPFF